MAIQLDIEEIIGAGCLASIGRAFSALTCLWLGAATGIIGSAVGTAVAEAIQGGTVDVLEAAERALLGCLFGPLVMFGSLYILVFFPLVLSVYFTFTRSEEGLLKKWVIFAGVTGLFALLSRNVWTKPDLLAAVLGLVTWLGLVGSLGMAAFSLTVWQQRRMAQHLMGLEAANDARRAALAAEHGTAVADREFATGEAHLIPPAPEASRNAPEPPVPRPERNQPD